MLIDGEAVILIELHQVANFAKRRHKPVEDSGFDHRAQRFGQPRGTAEDFAKLLRHFVGEFFRQGGRGMPNPSFELGGQSCLVMRRGHEDFQNSHRILK